MFTCRKWFKSVETHNYALVFHKDFGQRGNWALYLFHGGYKARLLGKKGNQKDTCHNENGLCTKTNTILALIMTQIARLYGIL